MNMAKTAVSHSGSEAEVFLNFKEFLTSIFWILLEQETVSGSGISWAICMSAPGSRQITTPAPHHSVVYRSDAAQPTA